VSSDQNFISFPQAKEERRKGSRGGARGGQDHVPHRSRKEHSQASDEMAHTSILGISIHFGQKVVEST
jgi:hypothetical protein